MDRSKPKLLYFQILNYSADNIDLIKRYFRLDVLNNPSEMHDSILREVDALLFPLGYYFGPKEIEEAKRLKCIGSNTTGHPHIDVEYAKDQGITVVTLKNEKEFLDSITPTAELTWGLIIALTRNIGPAAASVLAGEWDRWPFGGERMLSRMSLGVAGAGRLGQKVATYGRAFGMKVYYYDPYVDLGDAGFERLDSLETLVAVSDIVSVHIPHEPETENLFDRKTFTRFKQGSFFINTSRGELVDESALLEMLESGDLAGAAVDVLDGEFRPGFGDTVADHSLVQYARERDNLIITPHIGGSTRDAWSVTQEYTIRKMVNVLGLDSGQE